MGILIKQKSIKSIFAFVIYFLLSIYITWPLIFHLGDSVTGYGDELIIAWIQNWVIHILTTGNIFSLWSANIYFPFHNSFAYSDALITSSLLSFIPFLIMKQPVSVVNVTFISSLILLGFSLYLLCFYITEDFFASLLTGVLVIFSPAVLDKAVHLQILAIEWVPLAILFFLLFIDSKKTRYFICSLLCFLLQTYNSFVPGYFIVFSYVIICVYSLLTDKEKIKHIFTIKNGVIFLLCLFFVVPLAIPYYQVSSEYHYVRDIRDTIHFSLQPEDFLYSGTTSRLHDLLLKIPFVKQTSPYGEVKPGYIGFVFTLLALYTLFFFLKTLIQKNFLQENNYYLHIFSIISLFGILLSLGPFLHINRQTIHKPFPIPLPYALFYYIIPGFKGIRDTERWEMFFIIAIPIAIAIVMHQLLKKFSFKKTILIYSILFLGIITEFRFPLQFYPVPQVNNFPKVYAWLATTPKDTKVIFEPIFNWNQFPYTEQEIWRQYYSTLEWRNMANGYTGFSPPAWQTFVENQYANFPKTNTISQIKNLGINYIIVDKKLYDTLYKEKQEKMTGDEVINVVKNNNSITFIRKIDTDYVFKIK